LEDRKEDVVALDDLEDTAVDQRPNVQAIPEAHEPTAIIRNFLQPEPPKRDISELHGLRPRLVCVTPPLAGKTYEVERDDVVIGRTPDNDIVIDHRSVSRHHCRIVTSEGRSKVIDSGSANGILVNGEPYKELVLKNGDLLELGHVQLRFVPPGDTYVLTPTEMQAIEKKSYPWLIALVILVLGAGAVYWFVRPVPDVVPVKPVVVAPVLSVIDKQLSGAQKAFGERRWQEAINLTTSILTQDPAHNVAKDLQMRSEYELRHQGLYDKAVAAQAEKAWQAAWDQIKEIPQSSVYFTESEILRSKIKSELFRQLQNQAEKAIAAEQWDEADRLAGLLSAVDSDRPEVKALREWIADGRQHKTHPQKKLLMPKPKEDPFGAFDAGVKALSAGQLDQAVSNLTRCIQIDSQFARCYRALGITYARLGDGPKSAHYYKLYLKVDPTAPDIEQVKQILHDYEK
jgi:hypothetical protein